MTILQVYLHKSKLTGAEIICNKDGDAIKVFVISVIDLLYVELPDDKIKIITNRYGPSNIIIPKSVFELEFLNVDITKEELETQYF